MDTLNYLKAVKDGQFHFADGSVQIIPHWNEAGWTHVFAVRHAEKEEDDPYDPQLSALGDARAEHLGRIMAEAGLDAVYASSSRRAFLTAEPVQRRSGLNAVRNYELDQQEEWIPELLENSIGQKILIVGHQHNIPHLLNQLNGGGFVYEHIPGYDYGKFFAVATSGPGKCEIIELRY